MSAPPATLLEPAALTADAAKGTNRQIRCGTCSSCTAQDCGQCANCTDMPKFGGPGHKKQACSRRKCLQLTPCKLRKLLAPPSAKRQKTAAAAAALRPVPEQSVLPHDFGPFVSPRGEAYADPTSSALTFLPIQLLSDSLMAIVPSLGDERGQAAEPAGGQAHRKGAQGYNSPSVSAQASPSIQADAFDSFVGAGLDADTEGARLDDGAELGLGASSSACALASSPLRARALALEPLPLCAVTRADVAVDSLNDAKLDWSWLALANIEEEFVNMRDLLADERPEQAAPLPSVC